MKVFSISLFIFAALSLSAGAAFAAKGDASNGKAKSAACIACHGANGNSFNPDWPKLAGQSAQYIVKQLLLFKSGQRKNPLMSPMAVNLSQGDMEDLGAYYAAQEPQPGAVDPKYEKLGRETYRGGNLVTKVPACLSCHGPTGIGNPAAAFPRLSFQHASYIEKRLFGYRDGSYSYKGSEIMNGIATFLSDEEIKAVSSYVQGLH